MHVEIEYVSRLVRTVLIQLGDQAPDWRIGDIGFVQIGNVLTLDEPTDLIRVALESVSGSYSNSVAQFTTIADLADATVELATQVSEAAIEATNGGKLPPCPGHNHPAVAMDIGDVPKWVCMQEGVGYYVVDVLPGLTPGSTLVDYMRNHPAGVTSP